jgi:AraC-like DNA-binding protein
VGGIHTLPYFIQKMPVLAADYFRYFPVAREAATWGLAVTAAGFTQIRPHAPYPPVRHPDDHHFEWSRGRVLEALQIVLITAGRGQFESIAMKPQAIEAGNAFILFPGVWHRYRPDPETGWVESWIELRGSTIDQLLRKKIVSQRVPILRDVLPGNLESCLEAVHLKARQPWCGFDPELAARGLAVLAAWQMAKVAPLRQTRIARAVAEAERYFAEHLAEPMNVSKLSRRLGVASSHLRKEFKSMTGYAPWQYVIHMRLASARRLLTSSDISLKEVAGRVGFNSAFHLSDAFKRAYGVAPAHWRCKYLTG